MNSSVGALEGKEAADFLRLPEPRAWMARSRSKLCETWMATANFSGPLTFSPGSEWVGGRWLEDQREASRAEEAQSSLRLTACWEVGGRGMDVGPGAANLIPLQRRPSMTGNPVLRRPASTMVEGPCTGREMWFSLQLQTQRCRLERPLPNRPDDIRLEDAQIFGNSVYASNQTA